MRRMGPGALPLYPTVLMTVPGAISTLAGAMRSVKSGLAKGRAASAENRGNEASAAPTAVVPVTARNSLRFTMSLLQRWNIDLIVIGLHAAMIQSRLQGVKLESCPWWG